jgi:S1-C subfamily serine protease
LQSWGQSIKSTFENKEGIPVHIKNSDMIVVLTHLSGGQAGQRDVLDKDRIRLGRALDNDVVFTSQDLRASAHHCEIGLAGDQFMIEDLQSTNGTYLNGARVKRSPLSSGQVIEFGRKGPRLLFELKLKSEVERLFQKPWAKGTTISPSARLMVEPLSDPSEGRSRRFGLHTMQLAVEAAVKQSSSGWRRIAAVLAVLTLVALGALIYMTVVRPGTGTTPPSEDASGFSAIAQKNQAAVVLVQLDFQLVDQRGEMISEGTSEGTGFALDASGYIATNYHIVRPWEFDNQLRRLQATPQIESLTLIFADHKASEAIPATIYRASKERDVAILAITPPPAMPLVESVLTDGSQVRQGEEVAFIGFPLGSDLLNTTQQERATTTFRRATVGKVTESLIQLDAPIQSGYSGSPIFNREGKVVGIVTAEIKDDLDAKSLSIGLGTPIKHVVELLGES